MMRPITTAATLVAALLATGPAMALDPFMAPDEKSVSMSGTVASASRDSFIFDYGGGFVTVAMDDEDVGDETGQLQKGDHVTVYGEIDDDPMQATRVLASAVYVHERDVWYVAGAPEPGVLQKDGTKPPAIPKEAEDGVSVRISGTVAGVGGELITLSTGSGRIDVDTTAAGTIPGPPLKKGDVIEVRGTLDGRFVEERVLRAKEIESIRSAGSQPVK